MQAQLERFNRSNAWIRIEGTKATNIDRIESTFGFSLHLAFSVYFGSVSVMKSKKEIQYFTIIYIFICLFIYLFILYISLSSYLSIFISYIVIYLDIGLFLYIHILLSFICLDIYLVLYLVIYPIIYLVSIGVGTKRPKNKTHNNKTAQNNAPNTRKRSMLQNDQWYKTPNVTKHTLLQNAQTKIPKSEKTPKIRILRYIL